jgi:hypothetical protein
MIFNDCDDRALDMESWGEYQYEIIPYYTDYQEDDEYTEDQDDSPANDRAEYVEDLFTEPGRCSQCNALEWLHEWLGLCPSCYEKSEGL